MATISAGSVDGLLERDPDKYRGRHAVESIAAGLTASHLLNGDGSRSRSQSRRGQGRSDASRVRRDGYASNSEVDDSDLGSSDEEKRTRKKNFWKELITSGLAAAATIHAAHSVIQGIEGHKKREKQAETGFISQW